MITKVMIAVGVLLPFAGLSWLAYQRFVYTTKASPSRMNDAAKEWVAALRSGKYEQGQEKLEHNGTFCCLGVASRLALDKEPSLAISKASDVVNYGVSLDRPIGIFVSYYGELVGGTLSETVRLKLGMSKRLHPELAKRPTGWLVYKNDVDGLTFPQIADFIEENQEFIFVEPEQNK